MSSSKDQVYVMTPETPLDLFKEKKYVVYWLHGYRNVMYQLGALMPARESRVVEYKAGGGNYAINILPTHINKYGSAFLNSSGGTLCIGVNDDALRNFGRMYENCTNRNFPLFGTVAGVYANYSGKERIRVLVREQFSRFTPPVDKQYYTVEFVPCNKQDYYVIEIHVKPGDKNEIYSDGDDKMYIRRDGSVQGPLWPREIRDIVASKFFEELGGLESLGDSNKNPLASLSTGTPVLGRSNSKK